MKYLILAFLSLLSSLAIADEAAGNLEPSDFKTPPKRIVTIEWAMTETLLSLGVTPVGMADKEGYNEWVKSPELPAGIKDVGARNEPNLELISTLKPDLIVISSNLAPAYDKLRKIAPTLMFDVYSDTKTPLHNAEALTLKLGQLLDKQQKAKQVVEQTQDLLKRNGEKIHAAHPHLSPLLFVRFVDNSTLHFQGRGSLLQDTIDAMGLKNEWHGQTSFWGFSIVDIAKIAEHQTANVILMQSLKEEEKQKFIKSPLWQAMAFTREHRVYQLPHVWSYGGLLAVQSFSNQLVHLLNQTSK